MAIHDQTSDNAMAQALRNSGATAAQPQAAQAAPQVEQAQPAYQAQPNVANQPVGQGQPEMRFNQNQYQQPENNGLVYWGDISGLNTTQINYAANSQALVTIEKALRDYWADNLSENMLFDLVPLDRQNVSNLAVSVLVFVNKLTKDANSPVYYHTWIIEGSVDPFRPQRRNVGREQIDVMVLTSDTYDSVMMATVEEQVRLRYPEATDVVSCDAAVLNRDFDVTDKEALRRLTLNARLACRVPMNYANKSFQDLNVAYMTTKGGQLVQDVRIGNTVEEDALGLPVRSDVVMEMALVHPQNQNNAFFSNNREIMTRATGYIDLLYDPVATQVNQFMPQGGMMFGQPQQQLPTTFRANLVLTSLMNIRIQTLPGILLALMNASGLAENNAWCAALKPQRLPNGKPGLHDIGAIGYDLRPDGEAKRIATTPDVFDMNSLSQLIGAFFHPGLIISVDIPKTGANTWALAVFAEAAIGNRDARQSILEAMNILTNGHFEPLYYNKYNGDGSFFRANENTIQLGYYIDKDGLRSDSRDLDYLAVAGLAGDQGNLGVIEDWTESFNAAMPIEKRLAVRQAIQQNLLSGLVYTGDAIRAEAEAAFIEAGKEALRMCGYNVVPQMPYNDQVTTQRARASYVTGAVLSSGASGVFRTGGYVNQPVGQATFWRR